MRRPPRPHVRTIHTSHGNGHTTCRTYQVPALPRHVLEANARDMQRRPLTLPRKEATP